MGSLFLMIVLYVFNGHAVLEQRAYPSMEQCQAAGSARVNELRLDTDKYIVTAGCAKVPGQEASK